MARLPSIDPDNAPEGIREVLAGSSLNLLGMVAHAESAFDAWLRYSSTLLRRLELDPLLRELAILEVAHLSSSEYEWTQHVSIAKAVGANDQQIEAIAGGAPDGGSFDARQLGVLHFTREVVLDGAASEEAVARLSQELGNRQLIELLLVIGNYMGIARLIATTGLEAQEPVFVVPPGASPG
jgi:4-carboxymuconolactone decarboxylase